MDLYVFFWQILENSLDSGPQRLVAFEPQVTLLTQHFVEIDHLVLPIVVLIHLEIIF